MKHWAGRLLTTLKERIMETTPTSGNTSPTETAHRPCLKGEIECRAFTLICGEFARVCMITEHGTCFVKLTDTQVALLVEDGSKFIADKIRQSAK